MNESTTLSPTAVNVILHWALTQPVHLPTEQVLLLPHPSVSGTMCIYNDDLVHRKMSCHYNILTSPLKVCMIACLQRYTDVWNSLQRDQQLWTQSPLRMKQICHTSLLVSNLHIHYLCVALFEVVRWRIFNSHWPSYTQKRFHVYFLKNYDTYIIF